MLTMREVASSERTPLDGPTPSSSAYTHSISVDMSYETRDRRRRNRLTLNSSLSCSILFRLSSGVFAWTSIQLVNDEELAGTAFVLNSTYSSISSCERVGHSKGCDPQILLWTGQICCVRRHSLVTACVKRERSAHEFLMLL